MALIWHRLQIGFRIFTWFVNSVALTIFQSYVTSCVSGSKNYWYKFWMSKYYLEDMENTSNCRLSKADQQKVKNSSSCWMSKLKTQWSKFKTEWRRKYKLPKKNAKWFNVKFVSDYWTEEYNKNGKRFSRRRGRHRPAGATSTGDGGHCLGARRQRRRDIGRRGQPPQGTGSHCLGPRRRRLSSNLDLPIFFQENT